MRSPSLQRNLIIGVGASVLVFVFLHAALVYRETLSVVNVAYDRTLLATAKTIGESLSLRGDEPNARVVATVPYSALEAFEADGRTRMAYRVLGIKGELVSGYPTLKPLPTSVEPQSTYAALVEFFDSEFEGAPVRVARLMQPVANADTQGMATVEVVETLELRTKLAKEALLRSLLHHSVLLAVLLAVVWLAVYRATRRVRHIRALVEARAHNDLSPIDISQAPIELRPALEASNRAMARALEVANEQKRFVRDASHQLRTPLAVLKVQTQSAMRGDVEPMQGLYEIYESVERATNVANQMLALAKVEQLRLAALRDGHPVQSLDESVREIALELAPLIADKELDFELHTQPAHVHAHSWMLRELTRNLLANAIRFCPRRGALRVDVLGDGRQAVLIVEDSGPGMSQGQLDRLFQPFTQATDQSTTAADAHSGAGLGLVICHDICDAIDARLTLENASRKATTTGLVAIVRMAAARNPQAPTPP
jgi:two-component system, OmpR family, sensor histidine kinase TctE